MSVPDLALSQWTLNCPECTSCVLLTSGSDQWEHRMFADHWTDQAPLLPLARCQDTSERVLTMGRGYHLTILTNSSGSFPNRIPEIYKHCSEYYTMTIDLHNLWIKEKQTIIWPFPVFRFRLGMFLVKAGETWYRRSVSVSLPFLDLQNTLSSIDQTESRLSQVKVWTLMGELIIYQTSDKEEWAQFIRSP